ncbi:hypothetical protein [Acinetobacter larvae]|uniref:Uncharacterized protein n=1 Tax=Acinetobacter larvae TaxID=1789224 RepID=A0A1B2M1T2_9GAMM|nr:hypothetical protein [Acinetobacter larvae]AOA59157.1 hypothetical protein BFG52_12885 [Acinetobacter larvae]
MALDQIWKQQLALVCYGNQFLTQHVDIEQWIEHTIFKNYDLQFRSLEPSQLLAQHFKIWLTHLKAQGVSQLSLHPSSLIASEANPNPQVELLELPHIIISHHPKQKFVWMIGKELAAWDSEGLAENLMLAQTNAKQQLCFWRYALPSKYSKHVNAALKAANWDEIEQYLQRELFQHPFSKDFIFEASNNSYTGLNQANANSLLPPAYPVPYIHQSLYRLDALSLHIGDLIQHPYQETGEIYPPEQQQQLRQFADKISLLQQKFIVKVANHYQTATLTMQPIPSATATNNANSSANVDQIQPQHNPPYPNMPQPAAKHEPRQSNAWKLVLLVIVLCALAYYFGW